MCVHVCMCMCVQDETREQFNAAEYCHEVVFNGVKMSSIPPPMPYKFEEYLFKVSV